MLSIKVTDVRQLGGNAKLIDQSPLRIRRPYFLAFTRRLHYNKVRLLVG